MNVVVPSETSGDDSHEMSMTFPQRLMEILSCDDEYSDVISWIPNGAAFVIYKKKKFSTDVLPKFFKQSKFTSFTRKLNRWGFIRVTRGPQTGSYFHKLFHRDQPDLCLQMRCQNVRQQIHEVTAATPTTMTSSSSSITRALLTRSDNHDDDLSLRHPTLLTTQGSLQHFNSLPFNSGMQQNGNLTSPLMGLGLSSSLTGMTNTNSLLSNPVALMQMKLQLQQLQQQQQQKRLQLQQQQQQQQQVHNEMLRRAMASQASANATRAQLMMGANINTMMMMPPSPLMTTHSKEGLKFLQMLGLQKSNASSMSAQPLLQAMQSSLFQTNQMGMTKTDPMLHSSSVSTASNNLLLATQPPQPIIDPDQAVKRASAA